MRFRIETLGPFKLVNIEDGTTIPLRSNARLLSHLAVRAPRFVSRKALIGELWPEVDSLTANNRLRVALNKLRQLMPEAIVQGQGGLTLNLEVVECDALVFLELLKEASDTTREEDELDSLLQAIGYFRRSVGPSKFDTWNLADLTEILSEFYKACTRATEIGLKLRRDDLVCEVCAVSLLLWPNDIELWKANLQARMNLGQGESAVREISTSKDQVLLSNKDIRALVNRILKGDVVKDGTQAPLSAAEAKLSAEILRVIIATKPDLARIILSSPETLTLAGSNPKQMLSLLERVVSDPLYGDEHWERCMARIVGLKAWLNDVQGVLDFGHQLVERSSNPIILRATWNAIGIAYSLRREWPEAMAAVETTIRYAEETGIEMDVLSACGNRAHYLWLQGYYEESVQDYDQSLGRVKEIGTPQAEFEYIVGSGNRAFIPVMQGNWPLALEWIEACQEMRAKSPAKVPMGTLLPCLAMVRMMVGNREGVLPMLRQGFLEMNETESERFQQITFEFAACTLACTEHKSYARAVIDWVEDWRTRTRLPRAKAEEDLCQLVFGDLRPTIVLTASDTPSKVGRELLSRLRHSLRA